MRKHFVRILCCLFPVIALISIGNWGKEGSAQTNVEFIEVAKNLSSPVLVTNARDGSNRLFIVEQTGTIRILPPGAAAPLATPFIDLTTKLVSGGERGLLGLAFHPQYSANRRFFVNYTRRNDGATIISEFLASASDPNIAETAEKIILTISQPFSNHNGGMIEFGPDGFLYIGTGDGGSANDPGNRSQNIEDLLGKMLRIDVNTPNGQIPYSSPATNPFFGSTPGRDEIYAIGLRNPWRWSFDRATGQLYAGDVGQGQIEEISVITLGGNYGWRVFEGTRCTGLGPASCTGGNFVAPIAEYNHDDGRCSITGGYVYRGSRSTLPVGSYIYGDYCNGEMFIYNNGSASRLRFSPFLLSSFGEDEAGELYAVDLDGSVHRIARPAAATTVSAANYRGASLARESIVAAFGTAFSTLTQSATPGQPLPTTLSGATIRVRDSAGSDRVAPLFFVSPTQINYQIPPGTNAGQATVTFFNTNGAISTGAVNIANVAPGVFSANSSGSGVAAAVTLRIRSNGSQVFEPMARFDQGLNQFVPIPINVSTAGEQVFLVLFGTGLRFRNSLTTVTATVGGTPVSVEFVGAQGDFIGLDQANLRLPASLAGRGEVDVVLIVDGQTANTVRVSIN